MSGRPGADGPLFDQYLMVDWSAHNGPKTGTDSIWACQGRWDAFGHLDSSSTVNPATRCVAMGVIEDILRSCLESGQRMLIGFDFSFSYPLGLTSLCPSLFEQGRPPWEAIWTYLEAHISDDDSNHSNRFVVADEMNRASGYRLFWGRPASQRSLPYLPVGCRTLPAGLAPNPCPRLRVTEAAAGRRIKSTWQLFCGVSVGSQSLVGIPRLARLRRAFPDDIAVWPFETPGTRPVTIAEIWPGAVPFRPELGAVRDEAQVRSVVEWCAASDRDGTLPALLAPSVAPAVLAEEGWILGV